MTESAKQLLDTPQGGKWKRIGLGKRTGVLAPLFSVYSGNSAGIGDFNDLKFLADWCEKTDNSILELLPMNEVGYTFCPYDAVSSFALEPAYISFDLLPYPVPKKKISALKEKFPVGRPHVDYGVKEAKAGLLREIYSKKDWGRSRELRKFIDENSYWIDDFALYKTIKDAQDGKPWYDWQRQYKARDRAAIDAFRKDNAKEILFQMWVQWLAFGQFKAAKAHAASKGVLVKGDLPILISRDSADVWAYQEFFKLEFAAGAPPDMYCAKGQRWGTPTYDWEKIRADGYRYLKEKLKTAENFYDMLRIDHVVGLFRIWSIPYGELAEDAGLNGSFDPPDENRWAAQGREILSVLLESTGMLLCAEDLGVIPEACPKALKEFGIPGNDVQRWTKDWKVKHDFLAPEEYRLLSVTMLSTHDTTNWAAWWENEAGTVDEQLFMRKCEDRRIDYNFVKEKLFNPALSGRGRLRWLKKIRSADILIDILAKKREELLDFIEMYENSYAEKEKLWRQLNIKGPMRERADKEVVRAALGVTMKAKAIFRINLIIDLLYPSGIFKGDPYQYRINTPGTVSDKNWSFVLPRPVEDLPKTPCCGKL